MGMASDKRNAARAWFDGWVVRKGGPGSGNKGHKGIPGYHGGSAPRGGGTVYDVGITSYRDGKEMETVRAQMKEFEGDLKSTPAKNVSVQEGTGGWEGGSEPTWITSYTDGPEALSVIASTAKKYEQDGALIMKRTTKGAEGAQPRVELGFDETLNDSQVRAVESAMVDAGLGGWTWGKRGGKTSVMAACIPQWGGEAETHLSAMETVMKVCQESIGSVSQSIDWAEMTTMDASNYDDFIL